MFDFFRWRDRTVPYRPGSAHTQDFGIRTIEIGNPLHLGNDRGAQPPAIVSPFDGKMEWTMLPSDSVAGSLLTIVPKNAEGNVELQVFHCEPEDDQAGYYNQKVNRGQLLPVVAGMLGLSTGPHTHTEVVVRGTPALLSELRQGAKIIYKNGVVDAKTLVQHCKQHGFDAEVWHDRILHQVETWQIEEMSDRYAVRSALPGYRIPHWGRGVTIHIDPKWSLDI